MCSRWSARTVVARSVPRPPRTPTKLRIDPASTTRVESVADLAAHVGKVHEQLSRAGFPVHFGEIVVDCHSPSALARFYAGLLGGTAVERGDEWAWVEMHVRGSATRIGGTPSPAGPRLAFQRVPEPKSGKVRIHLDFATWDIPGEMERVIGLGGSVLGEIQGDEAGQFVVCADPEGHEFCLIDV